MGNSLASELPDVLHAACEAVALALELLQREQPRAAERVRLLDARRVGRDVRERAGDDLRKLALEPRDLRAQRASRGGLVERPLRRKGRATAIERQLLNRGAHAASSS
ncbi:MAG TPA: hypothetical protein VG366_00190 [Solirubrobacteraceae bacterium]|nr:hypothetical protein [Solirubrobacteraceae bacterium]